ncbi:hypothetical protein M8J76_006731 [Diaphorina citri]|nr:hypothetical protein M8J76_006731 [Diaphorina citri]KAI5720246.1 hypothetical protein M8J77_003949 [Diaphorina citri]
MASTSRPVVDLEAPGPSGLNRCDTDTIIILDSDEETPDDGPAAPEAESGSSSTSEAVQLTQLEVNILRQRRAQFQKTENKTLEQYQVLIDAEVNVLQTILDRHRDDPGIHSNPTVKNMKEIVTVLCLDLIAHDPVELRYWKAYEKFCTHYKADIPDVRREVFETILTEGEPSAKVFCHMGYCEHNLSDDYGRTRGYLSRGLEKHKTALELYDTRLRLEIGECYTMWMTFDPNRTYGAEEKTIIRGEHIAETYEMLKKNLDLNTTSTREMLDDLVKTACAEAPCIPVKQFKQKLVEDLKPVTPTSVEVVTLEASLHVNDTSSNNAKEKLTAMFRTYWKAFVSSDKNPAILHRMIDSFSSMDLNATPVRRLLYLTLDIGLYYHCLSPEHVALYFRQLALEKTPVADVKTKLIFRHLGSDPRLNGNEKIWAVKFGTFLNLYGPDEGRLKKLMNMVGASLRDPDALLFVFTRTIARTLPNTDERTIQFVKAMFTWLNAQLVSRPETHEKMRKVLITWLMSRRRYTTAKCQYIKLRQSEETGGRSSLLTQLLGDLLLYKPVKREPDGS